MRFDDFFPKPYEIVVAHFLEKWKLKDPSITGKQVVSELEELSFWMFLDLNDFIKTFLDSDADDYSFEAAILNIDENEVFLDYLNCSPYINGEDLLDCYFDAQEKGEEYFDFNGKTIFIDIFQDELNQSLFFEIKDKLDNSSFFDKLMMATKYIAFLCGSGQKWDRHLTLPLEDTFLSLGKLVFKRWDNSKICNEDFFSDLTIDLFLLLAYALITSPTKPTKPNLSEEHTQSMFYAMYLKSLGMEEVTRKLDLVKQKFSDQQDLRAQGGKRRHRVTEKHKPLIQTEAEKLIATNPKQTAREIFFQPSMVTLVDQLRSEQKQNEHDPIAEKTVINWIKQHLNIK